MMIPFTLTLLILAYARFIRAQVIVTITVTATPTPSVSSSYSSDEVFRDTILDVSNRYRRQHKASALTWNDTLARSSYDWADKCLWKHSGGPAGENLAMGYPNATAAVEAWGDEWRVFDFNDPGFSHETGHFTQLVWKATKTVGCGRFNCGTGDNGHSAKGWYLVCQYYPPGNIVGGDFFGINVQRRAEKPPLNGAVRCSGTYEFWGVMFTVVAVFVGAFGYA